MQLGEMLAPIVETGNFYLYCKTIFDSGFCLGMQEEFTALKQAQTFKTVQDVINGPEFEHFVCLQRAWLPLFFHFKKLPLDRFAHFLLNDKRFEFVQSQDAMLQKFLIDAEGFTLWCVVHGADPFTLRTQTSNKLFRRVNKVERLYGPMIFLAAGFSASCAYRSLLDKYFMPALHAKYDAIKKKKAEKALKRQTARLYDSAASKYIETTTPETTAQYSETGFSSNPFVALKRGNRHNKQ